jgi:hypothetical protein
VLTIPDAVKALFKTDGTWKNFRAHFPGGEFPDITNASVVRESVRFTESVCSQQVMRFGLAEASMIEFETVGVGNMYGMLIECGIEIDTSSLSAAQISAIQADPGDGVLVLAADSDIGRGFYRIPYGTFRVKSCPRNQGAMTHRKVTAYSLSAGKAFANSPVEEAKLRAIITASAVSNYRPSIPKLFYAALGWNAPDVMSGFPKTSAGSWAITGTVSDSWTSSDGTISVQISMNARRVTFPDPDELYSLDMSGWDSAAVETALDWIEATVDGFGGAGDQAKAYMKESGITARTRSGYRFSQSLPVFYPYFVKAVSIIDYSDYITVPSRVEITAKKTVGGVTQTETYTIDPLFTSPAAAYKYTTSFPVIRGKYAPTATNDRPGKPGFTFIDAYNIQDVASGWLEINGQYARPARTGGCDILELDASAPAEIGPADMPVFWWDEYDVSPVGVVRYAYGENAERQVIDLTVGDGDSVYDLQDNYVLGTMANASPADIQALLQAGLIPQLAKVTYTPVTLTMRSWPWIQAGDALELTAEDGTVVNTFAMSRKISGIQLLTDEIESKGGELKED